MTARRKIITASAVLASLAIMPASAQDKDSAPAGGNEQSEGNLTTKATNPVGALIQLQLQDLFVPESDNSSGSANTGIIQPVIPYALGEGGYFQNIITRPTIPIVTTPKVDVGEGDRERETGMGDITVLTAPTHTEFGSKAGEFTTWGPIAALTLPTASDPGTGADVWSAGPGVIAVTNLARENGDNFMLGGLIYHLWGLEGQEDDADVDKTVLQPVVIYKFKSLFGQNSWYVRNPDDTWTYDWEEDEWNQIPLGVFAGRVLNFGQQPVNIFGGGWVNAVSSDRGASADYAFKLSFSFLFPAK
ncbi:MAG: hypothetical protein ACR2QJ_08790 [Geminicoccaceae bacterium]